MSEKRLLVHPKCGVEAEHIAVAEKSSPYSRLAESGPNHWGCPYRPAAADFGSHGGGVGATITLPMSKKQHPSPVASIEEMQNDLPYDEPINMKDYKRELKSLQIELLKAQRHIKAVGQRVVILFEGRDAAGKGGSIKRFHQHLNRPGRDHVALAKPNRRWWPPATC